MSDATAPAFEAISDANRGPILVVLSYSLIIICFIATMIRIASVFNGKRKFGIDDGSFLGALFVGLLETVMIGEAATQGLGRHIRAVTSPHLDKYYKYLYAANMLAILAMALAKFSVLHLMRRLVAKHSPLHKLYPIMGAAIGAWAVFSIFAIAFECGSVDPQIYRPGRCVGDGALWYPIIIINAVTDIVLAFMFSPVVWGLQMARTAKLTVVCLFGIRTIVAGTAIAQLVLLVPALHAADQTRRMITPAILGQVVLNLSLITAVTPSLHRFLADLSSSRVGVAVPGSQYELSQHESYGKGQSKKSWKNFSKISKSTKKSQNTEKTMDDDNGRTTDGRPRMMDFRPDLLDKNQASARHEPSNPLDASSRTSDGSQEMIIRQTVAWDVSHYDQDNSDRDDAHSNTNSQGQNHAI